VTDDLTMMALFASCLLLPHIGSPEGGGGAGILPTEQSLSTPESGRIKNPRSH
jgi:hypothetical protein